MNKSYIISVLLAGALLFTSYSLIKEKSTNKSEDKPQQEEKLDAGDLSYEEAILSVIHERKSVRNFTEDTVSKEDLTTIMKAGMAAPTGFDARPWQFIATQDKETMLELREELFYATALEGSPAAIIVCGDMSKVREEAPEFWITDASAATQNMLLAIEGMGLGGVWCTLYPGEERMQHAREVLNLPEHIMPLAVIPIGYPIGVEEPKDKYDPNNIHWEQW